LVSKTRKQNQKHEPDRERSTTAENKPGQKKKKMKEKIRTGKKELRRRKNVVRRASLSLVAPPPPCGLHRKKGFELEREM
jgi:hypothetical protein